MAVPPGPRVTWPEASPRGHQRARVPRPRRLRQSGRRRAQCRVTRASTGARRWCRPRCHGRARVPAPARRLRRRRLGGAGLRGGRRRAAGAIRGTGGELGRRRQALRCSARRPHAQPACRTEPSQPTGSSPSSADGPSWRRWTGLPKGSTPGRPPPRRPGRPRGGWPRQPSRGRRCSTATCAPTTCSSPGDGVVFVDWPHACVGRRSSTCVAWAPSVVLEGGPQPEELLRPVRPRGPRRPGCDRRPGRRFQPASWWRTRCGRAPPGLPTLAPSRPHRARWRWSWLQRLTGWCRPDDAGRRRR